MQRISLNTLKSIIRWCQLHRPNDVPTAEIFTGNEYIGVNRKLKIDFIPDDVVAQINEALKRRKSISKVWHYHSSIDRNAYWRPLKTAY